MDDKRRIEELEQEVVRQGEVISGLLDKDLDLQSLTIGRGELVAEIGGRACRMMAAAFAGMLEKGEGEFSNYIEMVFSAEKVGKMVLTLQRCDGKTPHEFRKELEASNLLLREELDALKESNGQCGRCAQLEDELANFMR